MAEKRPGSSRRAGGILDAGRLDHVVAQARQGYEERLRGYREQALKLYPWVCGRCGRSFDRSNLRELTVHHKNHDHDHNPPDGSNWELLCLYCHDNEHARYADQVRGVGLILEGAPPERATFRPFANLKDKLKPPVR
jgi:5-methylcytosine-specific restriction endonuclease McrA